MLQAYSSKQLYCLKTREAIALWNHTQRLMKFLLWLYCYILFSKFQVYYKKDGIPLVLFGSGGETQSGSLWVMPLHDILEKTTANVSIFLVCLFVCLFGFFNPLIFHRTQTKHYSVFYFLSIRITTNHRNHEKLTYLITKTKEYKKGSKYSYM